MGSTKTVVSCAAKPQSPTDIETEILAVTATAITATSATLRFIATALRGAANAVSATTKICRQAKTATPKGVTADLARTSQTELSET